MTIAIDEAHAYRRAVGAFLKAYGVVLATDRTYVELDLGNLLIDADFTDSDITKAQFISMVAAMEGLLTEIDLVAGPLYTGSDGSHKLA